MGDEVHFLGAYEETERDFAEFGPVRVLIDEMIQ